VTNGQIAIQFTKVTSNPKVNAIEITLAPPHLACGDLYSGSISAAGEVDFIRFTGSQPIVLLTLVLTTGWTWARRRRDCARSQRATVVTFNANGSKRSR